MKEKQIVVRFIEKIDDLNYMGVVICHSDNVNIAYTNDEPIQMELYHNHYTNIELICPYILEVLNENPVKLRKIKKVDTEVDCIWLKYKKNDKNYRIDTK